MASKPPSKGLFYEILILNWSFRLRGTPSLSCHMVKGHFQDTEEQQVIFRIGSWKTYNSTLRVHILIKLLHWRNQRRKNTMAPSSGQPLYQGFLSSKLSTNLTLLYYYLSYPPINQLYLQQCPLRFLKSASPQAPMQGIALRHMQGHHAVSSSPTTETSLRGRQKKLAYK